MRADYYPTLILTLVAALLLIIACAPPMPPVAAPPPAGASPVPGKPQEPPKKVLSPTTPAADSLPQAHDAARQIAANDLGVSLDDVAVDNLEAVDWNDASLGCPQPGYMYIQVVTPGYKATVTVAGKSYQVHMDAKGYGLICPPSATKPIKP